jgi:hypothetical protein
MSVLTAMPAVAQGCRGKADIPRTMGIDAIDLSRHFATVN